MLFSAPMVRALLDSSKTQTRRVMKPQPVAIPGEPGKHWWPSNAAQSMIRIEDSFQKYPGIFDGACPHGKPGDRIWVRETWVEDPEDDGTWAYTQHMGCKGSSLSNIPARFQKPDHCIFRSDWTGVDLIWRPSIHMPRWASRILLEIISVRVERVNEISYDDAHSEGVLEWAASTVRNGNKYSSILTAWKGLWTSINGPESWSANPWVWVIEFKVVKP